MSARADAANAADSMPAPEANTPPPVSLRGHHLICLQFYRGEGYSAPFVENLDGVLARLADEPALVIAGADAVCSACPELGADGVCAGETEISRIDALAFSLLGVEAGKRIRLAEARERLVGDAVALGRWRSEVCDGCAWEDVCERGWGRLLGDAEREARS